MFRNDNLSSKLAAAIASLLLTGSVLAATILPAIPAAGGGMVI